MKKEEKINYTNKENTNGAFVGIDEKYIPKNDYTQDKNTYVNENKGAKRATKAYLIGFAIFFILIFGTTIFGMISVFTRMHKMENDFQDSKSSTVETIKEEQNKMVNDAKEEIENNIEKIEEQIEEKIEEKTEETKTNNNKKTTNESTITQKELEEDAEKFQNGSDEDRQEVIDKYEDKAREELNKRGYDYEAMKEDAQRKADELRKQYGY